MHSTLHIGGCICNYALASTEQMCLNAFTMSIVFETRGSDSLLIETLTYGHTVSDGSTIRPAEFEWHLVLMRVQGKANAYVVGPLPNAAAVGWQAGAEVIWIRFKLGTYMPHLPFRNFLNQEIRLPDASSQSFWLHGSAWEFPTPENVDTFLARLAHNGSLAHDPLISAALRDQPDPRSVRTVRHRFLGATGLSQRHIRQMQRARRAELLLKQGVSILDTVHAAGYFDQPHLTRALKQYIGYTPAEIMRIHKPNCRSIQDTDLVSAYDADVLANLR